ncbi:hypothetical protein GYMLUDRAFT_56601 [Collybiopsis luxurians FD-317 M1]|nr:hypothetical protein GYMLUDRAFT_56601 [Collybiopsis luxurians FD-317 M1]
MVLKRTSSQTEIKTMTRSSTTERTPLNIEQEIAQLNHQISIQTLKLTTARRNNVKQIQRSITTRQEKMAILKNELTRIGESTSARGQEEQILQSVNSETSKLVDFSSDLTDLDRSGDDDTDLTLNVNLQRKNPTPSSSSVVDIGQRVMGILDEAMGRSTKSAVVVPTEAANLYMGTGLSDGAKTLMIGWRYIRKWRTNHSIALNSDASSYDAAKRSVEGGSLSPAISLERDAQTTSSLTHNPGVVEVVQSRFSTSCEEMVPSQSSLALHFPSTPEDGPLSASLEVREVLSTPLRSPPTRESQNHKSTSVTKPADEMVPPSPQTITASPLPIPDSSIESNLELNPQKPPLAPPMSNDTGPAVSLMPIHRQAPEVPEMLTGPKKVDDPLSLPAASPSISRPYLAALQSSRDGETGNPSDVDSGLSAALDILNRQSQNHKSASVTKLADETVSPSPQTITASPLPIPDSSIERSLEPVPHKSLPAPPTAVSSTPIHRRAPDVAEMLTGPKKVDDPLSLPPVPEYLSTLLSNNQGASDKLEGLLKSAAQLGLTLINFNGNKFPSIPEAVAAPQAGKANTIMSEGRSGDLFLGPQRLRHSNVTEENHPTISAESLPQTKRKRSKRNHYYTECGFFDK